MNNLALISQASNTRWWMRQLNRSLKALWWGLGRSEEQPLGLVPWDPVDEDIGRQPRHVAQVNRPGQS